METTIVSSYGRGGSSARVRLYDWMDHLRIKFNDFNYVNSADNSISTLARRPTDVGKAELQLRRNSGVESSRVILSRKASPFSNGTVESNLLKRAGIGVYDFDDSVMMTPRKGVQRLWSSARIWSAAVEAADVVIAGNDYLANQAEAANKNVIVVPSCVEPGDYVVKENYSIEHPTIVWIGSPSTEKYLLDIAPALLRAHDKTGVRLKVISSGNASLFSLEQMVDRVDWNPTTYAAALSSSDLGIMPLPDSDWTRGKCAYKLLQYGATGLPIIGSPVGANAEVLQMSNAPAPVSVDEWYDALIEILTITASERSFLGRSAYSVVREGYSFGSWKGTWVSATQLDNLYF